MSLHARLTGSHYEPKGPRKKTWFPAETVAECWVKWDSDVGFDALLDDYFGLDQGDCSDSVIRDCTTFKYPAMLVYVSNQ